MPADQQAVRVDAIRGAGNQGDVVLARDLVQAIGLCRQHDLDLVHNVLETVAGDLDVEGIAFLGGVEVVEHRGVRQASVAGDDGVRALAADGKVGAIQVA